MREEQVAEMMKVLGVGIMRVSLIIWDELVGTSKRADGVLAGAQRRGRGTDVPGGRDLNNR